MNDRNTDWFEVFAVWRWPPHVVAIWAIALIIAEMVQERITGVWTIDYILFGIERMIFGPL